MRNVPFYLLALLLFSSPVLAGPCGNGNVQSGEACDDGNNDNGDGCTATCADEQDCGNGTPDDGEECDDGNNVNGDGCDEYCINEPVPPCGNGTLDSGEQCDDQNTASGDGCSDTCQRERQVSNTCGNGTLDPLEGCDDGNTTNGPSCTATCAVTSNCGNGMWDPGEVCEDGNQTNGDGCSRYCELEVVADLCGNGNVDPGEACDDGNNNNNDACSNSCGLTLTVDVEGEVLTDPDKPGLGGIIPNGDSNLQEIYNFLNESFDKVDTEGPTFRVRSTTLSNYVILKYYARDTFPPPSQNPPVGNVKARFRLNGTVRDEACTGDSNKVCVVGWKFNGRPAEFLDSVPSGWTDNLPVPREYDSDNPIAVLILSNETNGRRTINPSHARLETENSVGNRRDITLPGNIDIEGLKRPTCKISVSGAKGPIANRACPGNNPCTTNQVTTVHNGALSFSVALEGLPGGMSTPASVTWEPSDHPNGASGLTNSGTWLFPPVSPDPAVDVQAEVETKNGQTVHCAVKVLAEGSEFSVKARFGGDCRTFTGLRDYYYLNGTNTAPQTQSLYSTLDNQPGLYFPGVENSDGTTHRYGALVADLPSGSARGINGPEVPFMGVMNGAMDNRGALTIGTGGVPQLPAFNARLFTDPIVTVTPFNPQADPDSRFGMPSHWGRINLAGDPTMIGMNSTGLSPAPEDLEYVVLRVFLPMSIKANGVEQRGLPNNLPLWSFQAEHDKMIPFMDDSCIPMFQVGAPLRQMSALDTNPKPLPESVASRTFCFNSRPIRFGDFRTGRINFKALMVTPQHAAHAFPTDLLSDSKKPGGSCNPAIPNDTVACWDAKFNDLPPNVGGAANDAHDDCAFMVLVQNQVVQYDRYGRPYTVTVPTWERRFRDNCPVLENPDECTGRLAIRFAGYSMLQTAALMCTDKYHNMDPAAGPLRDLNNVAVSPTLPGEGILPYGGTDPSDNQAFGGDSPKPFASYNFGSYPAQEGIGCIPCRFQDKQNLFATTSAIPLDAEGRVPIFTFRMGMAPRECVKNYAAGGTFLETRYFGSDKCDPNNRGNLPPGHFCSSDNIPNASCPGQGNIAASANIPLCPGSGFDYDQVAFSWSPLILDLKGSEIRISRRFQDAVHFDIKGDGQKVLIDWPLNTTEAAFLVRPDSKGRIHSIKQLFGDNQQKNGFEALRPYDSNRDGVVDKKDRKFKKLALWFDRNRNGRSDAGEIESLSKAGVERIYLKYNKPSPGMDIKGKTLAGLYFNNKQKKVMNVLDVYFHEYWKNGLPVGWKPLKRDIAKKRK